MPGFTLYHALMQNWQGLDVAPMNLTTIRAAGHSAEDVQHMLYRSQLRVQHVTCQVALVLLCW
jgi:hypothetical protein